MKVYRGFKVELDLNDKQRTLLVRTAGCARFAWNWGLGRRIAEYKETGKSSNAIAQHKQLNALKAAEFPWMYEVSKCAPQEALRDLDRALNDFFRRCRAGEKPGFPKFKSKHRGQLSFRINSKVPVEERRIRLPNIGWVKLKECGYLPISGAPGTHQVRVTVKGTKMGRWFVAIQYEIEVPDAAAVDASRTVGVDVGLIDFIVTSDGDRVRHPHEMRVAYKRLRRLQRRVSRRKRGSRRRNRAVQLVAAQYFKVSCKRRDFLHKLSTSLVIAKPDAKFVLENLNIRDMKKNGNLANDIADSGWGEFARMMQYKAGDARFVKADRWFPSSKMCSKCGAVNHALKLSERTFICPSCGTMIDRDLNAAVNLSRYEEYVASGRYRPHLEKELPPVRREVTPAESAACEAPRGSGNSALLKLSRSLAAPRPTDRSERTARTSGLAQSHGMTTRSAS